MVTGESGILSPLHRATGPAFFQLAGRQLPVASNHIISRNRQRAPCGTIVEAFELMLGGVDIGTRTIHGVGDRTEISHEEEDTFKIGSAERSSLHSVLDHLAILL